MSNDTAPLDVGRRMRAVREVRYPNRDDAAADYRAKTGETTALNTWSSWELAGKLSVAELFSVARVLRCDPCWMLTGAGEPFAASEPDAQELTAQVIENVRRLEQRFQDEVRETALHSMEREAAELGRAVQDRRSPGEESGNGR